jgi:hypothetical protein
MKLIADIKENFFFCILWSALSDVSIVISNRHKVTNLICQGTVNLYIAGNNPYIGYLPYLHSGLFKRFEASKIPWRNPAFQKNCHFGGKHGNCLGGFSGRRKC